MRLQKILLILSTLTLFFNNNYVFSQDDFIQFTRYDQLHWSLDGNKFAFHCILLDEARPEQIFANVLVKDLASDRLICLNPKPERFVISKDKKYVLFSSIYGLYISSLETQSKTVQLYFRAPTVNWIFQDFGFYQDMTTIYVNRFDNNSMETFRENYPIGEVKFTGQSISCIELKKLKKTVRAGRFNLPVSDIINKKDYNVKIKNQVIKFVAETSRKYIGNYQLISESNKTSSPTVLFKNCRPRLMSVNPNNSGIIISVFKDSGHITYRFNLNKNKLALIENKRYFSISWLDDSRYICITEDGMFLRNIELTINRKLDGFILPNWCKKIDLNFPKYELQVGFAEKKDQANNMVTQLRQSGYHARMEFIQNKSRQGYRIRVGGYHFKNQAQAAGKKLEKKNYQFWIDEIKNLYEYFNTISPVKKKDFLKKSAKIEYKKDLYLRSRILLVNKNRKEEIVVDEMNNIPGRSRW